MLTLHAMVYAQKRACKVGRQQRRSARDIIAGKIKSLFVMICSDFSTFLEKHFATEKTDDESLMFIYITASMYSIFPDRKHKSTLAPDTTDGI